VRLSGPRALEILRRMFRTRSGRPRGAWESHRLVLGFVLDGDERVDEVLAVYFRAPQSYTGEDVVELHGHGGPAPLKRIVDVALRAGARTPEPGEFTLRAFMNGRMDLAQAEAVIDIIRARTDLSLRQAMSQFSGKLSTRVRALQDEILDWMAQLEAQIDFPEDDIPAAAVAEMVVRADAILARFDVLLAGADAGRVLRDGVRIAIVGCPNVGKSSLLNALLGEDRAIVTDIPGTTRDSIEEWINVRGIPARIVDTAGIRASGDAIEEMGIERSRAMLALADLALVVLDAARGVDADDEEILRISEEKPRIVVLNKCDVSDVEGRDAVRISARTGFGIDALLETIRSRIFSGIPLDHEEVGGNLRHRDALLRGRAHLTQARETAAGGLPVDFITIDLKAAVLALGEITGSSVTDQVIRRIFTQFCLGK